MDTTRTRFVGFSWQFADVCRSGHKITAHSLMEDLFFFTLVDPDAQLADSAPEHARKEATRLCSIRRVLESGAG